MALRNNPLVFMILLVPVLLQSHTMRGSLAAQDSKSPEKGKIRTIAHDFLDLERPFGASERHYTYLDSLVAKAVSLISVKADESSDNAVSILTAIHDLLKAEGFRFRQNFLLSRGIDTKEIDCDSYAALYMAIVESVPLPILPVYAPNHSFVRFCFNDGSYINWEPTKGQSLPDRYYIKMLQISDASLKKGVYLKSLQRKEFLGVQFNNIGAYLLVKGKFNDSIGYFNESIKLYPAFSSPYHNRGTAHYALKNIQKALQDLSAAESLDPDRADTQNTLGDILFDLRDYDKALIHYEDSIRLNPANYVPYHNAAQVLKIKGKNELAEKFMKKSGELKRKQKR